MGRRSSSCATSCWHWLAGQDGIISAQEGRDTVRQSRHGGRTHTYTHARTHTTQTGDDTEELQFDMSKWSHYGVLTKLEDTVLKQAAGDIVSMVFHNQFD